MNKTKIVQSIKYTCCFNIITICMWGADSGSKNKYEKVETNKFSAAVKMMVKKLKTDH